MPSSARSPRATGARARSEASSPRPVDVVEAAQATSATMCSSLSRSECGRPWGSVRADAGVTSTPSLADSQGKRPRRGRATVQTVGRQAGGGSGTRGSRAPRRVRRRKERKDENVRIPEHVAPVPGPVRPRAPTAASGSEADRRDEVKEANGSRAGDRRHRRCPCRRLPAAAPRRAMLDEQRLEPERLTSAARPARPPGPGACPDR